VFCKVCIECMLKYVALNVFDSILHVKSCIINVDHCNQTVINSMQTVFDSYDSKFVPLFEGKIPCDM